MKLILAFLVSILFLSKTIAQPTLLTEISGNSLWTKFSSINSEKKYSSENTQTNASNKSTIDTSLTTLELISLSQPSNTGLITAFTLSKEESSQANFNYATASLGFAFKSNSGRTLIPLVTSHTSSEEDKRRSATSFTLHTQTSKPSNKIHNELVTSMTKRKNNNIAGGNSYSAVNHLKLKLNSNSNLTITNGVNITSELTYENGDKLQLSPTFAFGLSYSYHFSAPFSVELLAINEFNEGKLDRAETKIDTKYDSTSYGVNLIGRF